jgi:hypothetical protein
MIDKSTLESVMTKSETKRLGEYRERMSRIAADILNLEAKIGALRENIIGMKAMPILHEPDEGMHQIIMLVDDSIDPLEERLNQLVADRQTLVSASQHAEGIIGRLYETVAERFVAE